ncbi:MAG: hypothetical protein HY069_01075 [Chlamydiia bacterium]|nr:hypothetical protein [Chlamydiia bacterium]
MKKRSIYRCYGVWPLVLFLLTAGCYRSDWGADPLVAIQIYDRNGMNETISNSDRLQVYEKADFLSSQPYQKVLRVYRKEGKSHSKITTYHPNGSIWQYLEVEEMRANGAYKEWHPNGHLKVEAAVIGGTADVAEGSQRDWLFDGICRAWNEKGVIIAEVPYNKGSLEGTCTYYFDNAQIKKQLIYVQNELEGVVMEYHLNGIPKALTHFQKNLQKGPSVGYFESGETAWEETWDDGLLVEGAYFNRHKQLLATVSKGRGFRVSFESNGAMQWLEFQHGLPEGHVKNFTSKGEIHSVYMVKNGRKQGEETLYFLNAEHLPRMRLHWDADAIHGTVQTWYENGRLRSEREYNRNKKMGASLSWYKDGSVMCVEEYENDELIKGRYYKKGSRELISAVQNGTGVAHLYDEEGVLLRKIQYQKGKPIDPES